MELVNFNKKLSFHKWSLKKHNKSEEISVSNCNNPENLNDLDDDNINVYFEHIFKKFQKKKDPLNFRNNIENFEFKYTFYDYLKNIEFDSSYNLSLNQIRTLKFFIKTKPFSVIECDKNVGTC